MQMKIVMICLALLVHGGITGCTKNESNAEFLERQKAQTEIDSALDATHASIVRLAESSQDFDLVSQPRKESSSPERIAVHSEWLLSPPGGSTPKKISDAVIASCESLIHKHTSTNTKKLDFEAKVEEDDGSIRIRLDAIWDRVPKL
jgi:hypothetical protein